MDSVVKTYWTYQKPRATKCKEHDLTTTFDEAFFKKNKYEFTQQETTKLFFDIDITHDLAHQIRKDIIKQLDSQKHDYKFVYTDGSTPEKASFHIIFYEKTINKLTFKKEHAKTFLKDFLYEHHDGTLTFEQLFNKYIDNSVYQRKTFLRLPYATDKDKTNPHIPNDVSDMKRYFITYTPIIDPFDYEDVEVKKIIYKGPADSGEFDPVNKAKYTKNLSKLLTLVKKQRFQEYSTWRDLMFLMKGRELPEEDFIQYSKDSEYKDFDENVCRDHWDRCDAKPMLGLTRVIDWCKEDDIDYTFIYTKKEIEDKKKIANKEEKTEDYNDEDSGLLKEIVNIWNAQGEFTDFNMATALHHAYKDNLIYTSQGWFHYEDGWILGPEEYIFHPIIKLLTADLLLYVENKQQKCLQRMKTNKNDNEVALSKSLTKMKSAVNKLQSASKIKSILEVSKSIFRDDNALDTFDQKPNWFCFKNQIAWDLETKQIINIKPKDRILTTCGYDFPERKEADIKIVNDLLQQITPNLNSLLSALSLYLYGTNINELFIVFLGEGRNGKGLTIDILQLVLGNYYYSMPTEILTEQSKGKGQASPELAQARWSRCCMGSEPDENKTIVKTQLNMLTGREKITVRALHRDPFSYQPFFTMGLMCNVVLNVAGGINDAIKERMKIQQFPYTFVDEPTQDHHRQINTQLKGQVKTNISYRNGLLFLLLDTWFENQGKYISCQDSKEQEKNYAKQNNPLTEFLTNYESSTNFIVIKNLLKIYNSLVIEQLSAQKFKGFLEQAGVKVVIDNSNGHKCFLQKK